MIVFLLFGCGHTKKITKESDVKTELNATTDVKTESTTKSVANLDKEVTTVITEKVDTHVTIPSVTASVSRPLKELVEKGVIVASNGNTSVAVTYDPTTGTVRAEGKTVEHQVPIQAVKTTLVREDSKSSETTKTDTKKAENSDVTALSQTKDMVTETDKTGKFWLWFWVVVSIGFVLFITWKVFWPLK